QHQPRKKVFAPLAQLAEQVTLNQLICWANEPVLRKTQPSWGTRLGGPKSRWQNAPPNRAIKGVMALFFHRSRRLGRARSDTRVVTVRCHWSKSKLKPSRRR